MAAGYSPYLRNALARYMPGAMQPGYGQGMPMQPAQSMPVQGTAMPPAWGGQPPMQRSPLMSARPMPMPVRGTPALPTGGINSLRGYANL